MKSDQLFLCVTPKHNSFMAYNLRPYQIIKLLGEKTKIFVFQYGYVNAPSIQRVNYVNGRVVYTHEDDLTEAFLMEDLRYTP